MNGHAERRTDQVPWSQEVVKAACALAGDDGIRSIHVVTNERPTYSELVRYRHWANACDLTLTVGASSVTFQQRVGDRRTEDGQQQAMLLASSARRLLD